MIILATDHFLKCTTAAGTECGAHINDDDGSAKDCKVADDGVIFAFLGAGGTTMPALVALSGWHKFFNFVCK